MANPDKPTKGWFGGIRLPLARAYVRLGNRNRALLVASAMAVVALALVLVNVWYQRSSLVVGPLSSAHATLESNCAACHVSFEAVTNEKCSVCHERLATSLGFYTFAAHYVYVSGNQTRAFTREHEVSCATCHAEHRGRDARQTVVPDERCAGCHPFAPFDRRHPQFDFAAESIPDRSGLKFGHVKHTERILNRLKETNVEVACLTCHQIAPGGKGFEPISFARDCSTCHLGPETSLTSVRVMAPTGLLRRDGGRVEFQPGVETLDTIRKRQAPGEQWALAMSPSQFEEDGGRVSKYGIVHKDPWIAHNLRNLRRLLYPSQGLADLLVASADVEDRDKTVLYAEAIRTLREYAAGLRGTSEESIQAELAEIDRTAAELERRIADPATPLSARKFRVDRTRNPELSDEQVQAINTFAERVAEPCVRCHDLQDATIIRPQADQRTLRRAVFNHRAHVIQRGCLECHAAIPVLKYLDVKGPIDAAVDNAAIQDLPTLDRCRECHTTGRASTRCSNCHEFHPNKDTRSGLQPVVR
jgi:cytochrome c7-like protein